MEGQGPEGETRWSFVSRKLKKSLKRGDVILILVVVIIAAPFLWGLIKGAVIASVPLLWRSAQKGSGENKYGKDLTATISYDGKTVKKIPLNQIKNPQLIDLTDNGLKVTILAENGKIRFLHSECPDKICVKRGWLTTAGDIAICMPAKTMVTVEEG